MAGISSQAITRKWDFAFTQLVAAFHRYPDLPLEIGGGKFSLPEQCKWALDAATGETKIEK